MPWARPRRVGSEASCLAGEPGGSGHTREELEVSDDGAVIFPVLRMDTKREIGDSAPNAETMNLVPDRGRTSIEGLDRRRASGGHGVLVDGEESIHVRRQRLRRRALRSQLKPQVLTRDEGDPWPPGASPLQKRG